jgi:hypothetical protein
MRMVANDQNAAAEHRAPSGRIADTRCESSTEVSKICRGRLVIACVDNKERSDPKVSESV